MRRLALVLPLLSMLLLALPAGGVAAGDLLAAARDGDLAAVERMLEAGVEIDQTDLRSVRRQPTRGICLSRVTSICCKR